MPSFLSKVFGRKKHDGKEPALPVSGSSLLEGKFEAVSPPVSPTAINFLAESANGKDRSTFALFRAKSGPTSTTTSTDRHDELPHLLLNLPGPKDEANSRALGVVFEADPDGQIILPDSVIGERRLNPLEAIILVRACSQAIATRGLETLGIMHPHWYSASPDIQRKLISLFIQSLAPKSPITTLSPTPTAAVSAFESELNFTRSPHDVAAVLRWGLRHLKLEGNSLGREQAEWSWYKNFSEGERSLSYPPNAFSEKLVPQLPPAHLELLCATLEMISSLAAHAEANSISGSKLSKFLGLWLLSTKRSEEMDDWSTLYDRWERAGRILEHLFLSRIRDEAVNHRMPTRLLELVRHYPYDKGMPPSSGDDLLPRPRFSTRQYDALFIRIDTELSASAKAQPKQHPVRLIAEAFKAEPARNGGERYGAAWDKLKKTALDATEDSPSSDGFPTLSRIFADETIRFLSLVPADASGKEPSSTFNLFSRKEGQTGRRRSFSLGNKDTKANGLPPSSNGSSSGHGKGATTGTPAVPASTFSNGVMTNDWAQFSTSGFLETTSTAQPLAATLFDQEDVEKTVPVIQKPTKRRQKTASPARGRRSFSDIPAEPSESSPAGDAAKVVSKSTMVNVVQLDEAFVDFWSDALLDPVSSNWPTFVICKLKNPLAGREVGDKSIDWIIIEQTYSRPPPPQAPHLDVTSPESFRKSRASSPKPSFKSDLSTSRLSTTFSATRKRFSFFGGRTSFSDETEKSTKGRMKMGISPKIGEMGEILAEEEEKGDAKGLSKKTPDAGKNNGVGVGVFGAVAVMKDEGLGSPTPAAPAGPHSVEHVALPDIRETQAREERMAIVSNAKMETPTILNKPDEIKPTSVQTSPVSHTHDAAKIGALESPNLPAKSAGAKAVEALSPLVNVLSTEIPEGKTSVVRPAHDPVGPSVQSVTSETAKMKGTSSFIGEGVVPVGDTHAIGPETDATVTPETLAAKADPAPKDAELTTPHGSPQREEVIPTSDNHAESQSAAPSILTSEYVLSPEEINQDADEPSDLANITEPAAQSHEEPVAAESTAETPNTSEASTEREPSEPVHLDTPEDAETSEHPSETTDGAAGAPAVTESTSS